MEETQTVMVIDPGDHIGVVIAENGVVGALTIDGDNRNAKLWGLLCHYQPSTIVYESFALRANVAQKLVGSKFITCEVIGVIKLYAQLKPLEVTLKALLPSVKEYCGFSSNPKDTHYTEIQMLDDQRITEHVRDAYRLYSYYKLFGDKIFR